MVQVAKSAPENTLKVRHGFKSRWDYKPKLPPLGAMIGLAAGTYPACKASAIQPIAALRTGQ